MKQEEKIKPCRGLTLFPGGPGGPASPEGPGGPCNNKLSVLVCQSFW